ncbi:MAG: hypothetical protein IJX89_02190 [Alphaproteobacteria bacterium]|nr:hypothetical protein [Alphaproteobacteria bacterium]
MGRAAERKWQVGAFGIYFICLNVRCELTLSQRTNQQKNIIIGANNKLLLGAGLIAKGYKMKLKFTVPYVLMGAAMCLGTSSSTAQPEVPNEPIKIHSMPTKLLPEKLAYANILQYDVARENALNQVLLNDKADELCDTYMENMISAQQRLNPLLGRRGYAAAVRRELPGAPVYKHCVWGQHTQLLRALDAHGDTLTIIPQGARTACVAFKNLMAKKYSAPEYVDCIHSGVMHESDSAYNVALNKFLSRKHITADAPDSIRNAMTDQFAKTNFSVDRLDRGAILIVPRYRGSRNKFHAILYLGRGRVERGEFIADENGRHIYVGHNRETMGDLFRTYDASNVFAADTKKIAAAEYAKEWSKIENMTNEELVVYLTAPHTQAADLRLCSRAALLRLARDKHFKCHTIPNFSEPAIAYVGQYGQILHIFDKMTQRTI